MGIEGFGHVVICTDFEPLQLVSVFCFGSEHDDGGLSNIVPQRSRLTPLPDAATDLEAIHVRQHNVQDNYIGHIVRKLAKGLCTRHSCGDIEAVLGQVALSEF